nr:hypothetical protein [Myxococcus stipitatus]
MCGVDVAHDFAGAGEVLSGEVERELQAGEEGREGFLAAEEEATPVDVHAVGVEALGAMDAEVPRVGGEVDLSVGLGGAVMVGGGAVPVGRMRAPRIGGVFREAELAVHGHLERGPLRGGGGWIRDSKA